MRTQLTRCMKDHQIKVKLMFYANFTIPVAELESFLMELWEERNGRSKSDPPPTKPCKLLFTDSYSASHMAYAWCILTACKYFKRGHCKKGESCRFVHGK